MTGVQWDSLSVFSRSEYSDTSTLGRKDDTHLADEPGEGELEWQSSGGDFDNVYQYESDVGFNVAGVLSDDDLSGTANRSERNETTVDVVMVGVFDAEGEVTFDQAVSEEEVLTSQNLAYELSGAFTEHFDAIDAEINGDQFEEYEESSSSKYKLIKTWIGNEDEPTREGYFEFKSSQLLQSGKSAEGSYSRNEDDESIEGVYAYDLHVNAESQTNVNYLMVEDGWTLGNREGSTEPASITSDTDLEFSFAYQGIGTISSDDGSMNWLGDSTESGAIAAQSSGSVVGLASIVTTADGTTEAVDDFPELDWDFDGQLIDEHSKMFTITRNMIGLMGTEDDDISSVVGVSVDATYGGSAMELSQLVDDDWKLADGFKTNHSFTLVESQVVGRGSVDSGNMQGSVSFGSISINRNGMERVDIYNVDDQQWESNGERTEESLSFGGSTAIMAGTETTSAGAASISASTSIVTSSSNRQGKYKRETLEVINASQGTDTAVTTSLSSTSERPRYDWVKQEEVENDSAVSNSNFTMIGASSFTRSESLAVLTGTASTLVVSSSTNFHNDTKTYDVDTDTTTTKGQRSQSMDMTSLQSSMSAGDMRQSNDDSSGSISKSSSNNLSLNYSTNDLTIDGAPVEPEETDHSDALPTELVDVAMMARQKWGDKGESDIDDPSDGRVGNSSPNSGSMSFSLSMSDNSTLALSKSIQDDTGSGSSTNTVNTYLTSSFNLSASRTNGQWNDPTGGNSIDQTTETTNTSNFTSNWERVDEVYSMSGTSGWSNSDRSTDTSLTSATITDGQWNTMRTMSNSTTSNRRQFSEGSGTYSTESDGIEADGTATNRVDTTTTSNRGFSRIYGGGGELISSTGGGSDVTIDSTEWSMQGGGQYELSDSLTTAYSDDDISYIRTDWSSNEGSFQDRSSDKSTTKTTITYVMIGDSLQPAISDVLIVKENEGQKTANQELKRGTDMEWLQLFEEGSSTLENTTVINNMSIWSTKSEQHVVSASQVGLVQPVNTYNWTQSRSAHDDSKEIEAYHEVVYDSNGIDKNEVTWTKTIDTEDRLEFEIQRILDEQQAAEDEGEEEGDEGDEGDANDNPSNGNGENGNGENGNGENGNGENGNGENGNGENGNGAAGQATATRRGRSQGMKYGRYEYEWKLNDIVMYSFVESLPQNQDGQRDQDLSGGSTTPAGNPDGTGGSTGNGTPSNGVPNNDYLAEDFHAAGWYTPPAVSVDVPNPVGYVGLMSDTQMKAYESRLKAIFGDSPEAAFALDQAMFEFKYTAWQTGRHVEDLFAEIEQRAKAIAEIGLESEEYVPEEKANDSYEGDSAFASFARSFGGTRGCIDTTLEFSGKVATTIGIVAGALAAAPITGGGSLVLAGGVLLYEADQAIKDTRETWTGQPQESFFEQSVRNISEAITGDRNSSIANGLVTLYDTGNPRGYIKDGTSLFKNPTKSLGATNAPSNPNARTGVGYGVSDPPVRIDGDWTDNDLKQALLGHPPRGLGSPDLHHAGQMPGAGIHEVIPAEHRGNKALHPNKFNQGVTDEMREQDRQLHWWYRAREQGADQRLPNWIYDR
jgi:hypothetical protein